MAASAICLLEYESIYHQLYCGWSRENLRLGNFRHAAADGNLLSDVHTAGGLWLSARIAFNLDGFFQKACTCGKQALTMCMGFGCNASGSVEPVLSTVRGSV